MAEKVWIVTSGEYSDYRIHGVYTDKAIAEASAEVVGGQAEEWQVGTAPLRVGVRAKAVIKDGVLVDPPSVRSLDRSSIEEPNHVVIEPYPQLPIGDSGRWWIAYLSCWGETEERALKVASEQAAQIVAEWDVNVAKWDVHGWLVEQSRRTD